MFGTNVGDEWIAQVVAGNDVTGFMDLFGDSQDDAFYSSATGVSIAVDQERIV